MVRRALFAKCRTILRFLDALQNQAADAGIGFLGSNLLYIKQTFSIVLTKFPAQFITAFGDGPDPPPFAVADFKHLMDQILRHAVALSFDHARVLVFHFGATLFE